MKLARRGYPLRSTSHYILWVSSGCSREEFVGSGLVRGAASRPDESTWPSQPLQKPPAGVVGAKELIELHQGPRRVDAGTRPKVRFIAHSPPIYRGWLSEANTPYHPYRLAGDKTPDTMSDDVTEGNVQWPRTRSKYSIAICLLELH